MKSDIRSTVWFILRVLGLNFVSSFIGLVVVVELLGVLCLGHVGGCSEECYSLGFRSLSSGFQ